MFVVSVQLSIHADHLAAFLPLMQENAQNSRQLEPECHQFDVCQDPETPTQIYLYEVYTNAAAFDAHLASAHFQRFDAAAKPMIAAKDIRTYIRLG